MSEGPIICDSGPLIALSVVGQLELLPRLFERVQVPEAVFSEVVRSGAGRAGAAEVAGAGWIERVDVRGQVEPLLALELGRGEAEVISLARRSEASLVLIDERRARRIAEQAYGLRVKGSAGVLVQARRAGLVAAIRPLLEAMTAAGYHLSPRLVEGACAAVGEGDPPG